MENSQSTNQTAFIVDVYDPLNKKANSNIVHLFLVNERYWCIREVPLEWGVPQLQNQSIEEMDDPMTFKIYSTLEEAKEFARELRQLEAMKD